MLGQITEHICKYEDHFIIWNHFDFGRCFQQIAIVSPVNILLLFVSCYYCAKARCHQITHGNVNRMWIVFLRILAHLIIIGCQIGLIIEQALSLDPPEAMTIIVEALVLLAWSSSLCSVILWRRGLHSVTYGRDFDMQKIAWVAVFISCTFELYSAVLYTSGRISPLMEEPFSVYESINIYLRWAAYLGVILLQIPRSNHQNLSSFSINNDQEAGSSRADLNHQESVSEHSFNAFSRASFHWVSKIFSDARHTPFPSIEHLPFNLPPNMNPIANHCKLKLALHHYTKPHWQPIMMQSDSQGNYEDLMQPLLASSTEFQKSDMIKMPLLRSLNKAYGWSFWPLHLVKLVAAVLEISSPIVMNLLLQDLESGSDNLTSAIIYLSLLVLIGIFNSFIGTHLSYEVSKLQITMKGSLITELYSKVMNINLCGLTSFSVGELTNFASQDCERVTSHLVCFFEIWYMPLKLGIIFYLLYRYIGLAFLAGIGFCILLIPLNQLIAKKLHSFNEVLLQHRDKRMKLVHEVVTNMKSIKFFSWEESIIEKIAILRNLELRELKKIANFDAICVYCWACAPVLISFLIILTYSLLGNQVNASTIFTTLALVVQVILPLNALPWVIMGFIQAWVSLKRLQRFFDVEENAPQRASICLPFEEQNVIEVDNCSFYWKDPADCCLVGLQFQVNKGELLIVMGKTGSGKSSLLLALCQELNLASGELRLKEWKDGAGIVLQDCWIKSGSVRETILDGCTFDLYWYEQVIYACALDKDIANFPMGDETPVGVDGSALSGGQRLRLSLARAVYKNKQVYFIDDIFAGLDSQVALHIFQHCINGLLANKTRVISTHCKQFASSADTLMILDNHRIRYLGLPQMIDVPDFDTSHIPIDTADESEKDDVENEKKQYEESRQYGPIDVSVYKRYTKAAGFVLTALVLLSMLAMKGTDYLANWWLTMWIKAIAKNPSRLIGHDFTFYSDAPQTSTSSMSCPYLSIQSSSLWNSSFATNYLQNESTNGTFYLTVYGSLIAGNTIFALIRAFSFAFFGISATTTLHNNMLQNVMRAAMHFFDKTPVGVILNRFSSDIYTVDSQLPFMLNILLAQIFTLIGTLVMTSYGLPYILLTIIPLLILYHFIQKYYITAVREVKRLYSMSQSPLFTHFEQSVIGLVYIHSFRTYNSAQTLCVKFLESFQRSCFCMTAASAWLQLRLQLLATGVLLVASIIILTEIHYHVADAAILGLALTYALNLNSTLSDLISTMTEVEKEFVGAERVLQYTHELPIEVEKEDIQLVDYTWPTVGTIQFNKVSVRYHGSESRALNEVSFSVKAGEKLAIVGRTGAGKSSIFMALFRIVELETGIIVIDGTNIHDISSKVLRQKLSILPQQPLVFSGSIRENIDPFNKYTDVEIIESLKKCHLHEFVKEDNSLNRNISLKTLSSGESQLFSLARILLDKSKIFCFDEATSNVDLDTDRSIQKVIREELKDSTIVTVAHRIDTIIDYDRVLVFSRGQIVEEGKPKELIKNSSSSFRNLAAQSGYLSTMYGDDDFAACSSSH